MLKKSNFNYEESKKWIISNRFSLTRLILASERNTTGELDSVFSKIEASEIEPFTFLRDYDNITAALSLIIWKLRGKKDNVGVSPASMHSIRSAFTYSYLSNFHSDIGFNERKMTILNILLHDYFITEDWQKDIKEINGRLINKINPSQLIVREPILDYSGQDKENILAIQTFAYISLANDVNSPVFFSGLASDVIDTLLGPVLLPKHYERTHVFTMMVNFHYIISQTSAKTDPIFVEMFENLFIELQDLFKITNEELEASLQEMNIKSIKYGDISSQLLSDWKNKTYYPKITQ